jgi:hypothetical protein
VSGATGKIAIAAFDLAKRDILVLLDSFAGADAHADYTLYFLFASLRFLPTQTITTMNTTLSDSEGRSADRLPERMLECFGCFARAVGAEGGTERSSELGWMMTNEASSSACIANVTQHTRKNYTNNVCYSYPEIPLLLLVCLVS